MSYSNVSRRPIGPAAAHRKNKRNASLLDRRFKLTSDADAATRKVATSIMHTSQDDPARGDIDEIGRKSIVPPATL